MYFYKNDDDDDDGDDDDGDGGGGGDDGSLRKHYDVISGLFWHREGTTMIVVIVSIWHLWKCTFSVFNLFPINLSFTF